MAIKRLSLPSRPILVVYGRALGISTLKNIAYNTAVFLSVIFVFGNVPSWLYQYGFLVLFLAVTFLFAEWIFRNAHASFRRAALLTVATYGWDVIVMILLWSSLSDRNLFFSQRLTDHLVFFFLHALGMLGAWARLRRHGVKASLAEGLEA